MDGVQPGGYHFAGYGFIIGVLLSPMMESRAGWFSASLLVLGGLYQLTPLKQSCLKTCQAPVLFITQHWKHGVLGGFKMGLAQGWLCLGCCGPSCCCYSSAG